MVVGMERLLRLAEWREEPDREWEVEEKVWEERPEMVTLGLSSEVTMSGTAAERDGGLGCFHLMDGNKKQYSSFQIFTSDNITHRAMPGAAALPANALVDVGDDVGDPLEVEIRVGGGRPETVTSTSTLSTIPGHL